MPGASQHKPSRNDLLGTAETQLLLAGNPVRAGGPVRLQSVRPAPGAGGPVGPGGVPGLPGRHPGRAALPGGGPRVRPAQPRGGHAALGAGGHGLRPGPWSPPTSPVAGRPSSRGQTGFLVPAEDAGALAQAMGRFLDDPGLAARMGVAGRQYAIAKSRRAPSERRDPLGHGAGSGRSDLRVRPVARARGFGGASPAMDPSARAVQDQGFTSSLVPPPARWSRTSGRLRWDFRPGSWSNPTNPPWPASFGFPPERAHSRCHWGCS